MILLALLPALLCAGQASLVTLLMTCALPLAWMIFIGLLLIAVLGKNGYFLSVGILAVMSAWQIHTIDLWSIGHLFALLCTWMIAYLCFEDIRIGERSKESQHDGLEKRYGELCQVTTVKEEAWEQERGALQAELERLKQEAEQRRLEYDMQSQQMQLVSSEIEMLMGQKEQILRAAQQSYQVQQCIQESPQIADNEREMELRRDLARAEGLYRQLRMQFEEKSLVLDQTRRQLFRVEGECEQLHLERAEEACNAPEHPEMQLMMQELAQLECEIDERADEITALEALISTLLNRL